VAGSHFLDFYTPLGLCWPPSIARGGAVATPPLAGVARAGQTGIGWPGVARAGQTGIGCQGVARAGQGWPGQGRPASAARGWQGQTRAAIVSRATQFCGFNDNGHGLELLYSAARAGQTGIGCQCIPILCQGELIAMADYAMAISARFRAS
jgi:hypothetical protein